MSSALLKNMGQSAQNIKQKVQVNVPFKMLYDTYLERFFNYALNPEIGIDAAAWNVLPSQISNASVK